MALTPQALTIYAGTTETFPISLVEMDGVTPLNVTGYSSIEALFKRNLSDPDAAAVITATVANSAITVTNATTGQISVALAPSATAGISVTTALQFAVKAFLGGGAEYIGALGTLTITPTAVIGT